MKRTLCLAVASILAAKLSAQPVAPPTSLKIGTSAATNYYNQEMTVTGRVAQVTIRPAVTFMNLDKPYPNSPFSVVVFHGHSSFYGDANALKGKNIEIRGKIQNYRDKPEIVLDETNQLKVFDSTGKDITAAILNPTNAPPVVPVTRPPAAMPTNFPDIM